MASREQKSNREKKKPKQEKVKPAPASAFSSGKSGITKPAGSGKK